MKNSKHKPVMITKMFLITLVTCSGITAVQASPEETQPKETMVAVMGPFVGAYKGNKLQNQKNQIQLEDSQIAKFSQLKSDFALRTAPIEEKLRTLTAKFQRLLSEQELDMDEIGSLGSQITTQQLILSGLVIEHSVDAARLLTPQQRTQFQLASHTLSSL